MTEQSDIAQVSSTEAPTPSARWFVRCLIGFSLLWWSLNPHDVNSWVVGLPVVLLATWASAKLSSKTPFTIHLRGLLCFVPYFLLQSWRGGLDVAWRALHPRMPIEPALLRHSLHLPEGTARIFFINVVSLLPGTLSTDMTASTLMVHRLSGSANVEKELKQLEQKVAALFGINLIKDGSDSG